MHCAPLADTQLNPVAGTATIVHLGLLVPSWALPVILVRDALQAASVMPVELMTPVHVHLALSAATLRSKAVPRAQRVVLVNISQAKALRTKLAVSLVALVGLLPMRPQAHASYARQALMVNMWGQAMFCIARSVLLANSAKRAPQAAQIASQAGSLLRKVRLSASVAWQGGSVMMLLPLNANSVLQVNILLLQVLSAAKNVMQESIRLSVVQPSEPPAHLALQAQRVKLQLLITLMIASHAHRVALVNLDRPGACVAKPVSSVPRKRRLFATHARKVSSQNSQEAQLARIVLPGSMVGLIQLLALPAQVADTTQTMVL